MPKTFIQRISFLIVFCFIFFFSILISEVHAANANLVPNPTLQTASGSLPASWQHKKYGTNTATFSYPSSGGYLDNKKYVKVDISAYTDGGASWYATRSPVVVGETYSFVDYYKSTTWSYEVIEMEMMDGSITYQYLTDLGTASSWTQFYTEFTIPVNVKAVALIHEIGSVGSLSTDSYEIKKSSLSRPLISLTFDDNWESVYTNALPVLTANNLKSTQYIITGLVDTPSYMTTAEIKEFVAKGHELGSHTVTHPFLTTLTGTQLKNELSNSKQTLLSKFGVTATSLAIPYDDYNDNVITQALKYYSYVRNSDTGYNNLTNYYNGGIMSQYVSSATTVADIQGWIDIAKAKKQWLVLMYHQVDNGGAEYSTTPATFAAEMTAIVNSGVTVKTFNDAVTELKSQL